MTSSLAKSEQIIGAHFQTLFLPAKITGYVPGFYNFCCRYRSCMLTRMSIFQNNGHVC